jgi:hypothetical protein
MPISRADLPNIRTHICDLIRALEQFPKVPKPTLIIREAIDQLRADLMPSSPDELPIRVGCERDIVESQLDLTTKAALEDLLYLVGPSFSPTRRTAQTILKLDKWARLLDSTLPTPTSDGIPMCYVTLDNMAASVSRSKRTLEKLKTRKKNPLPAPDVEGGGGKPDEWLWSAVRPWLEKEYRRKLPEQFPGARIPDGRAARI